MTSAIITWSKNNRITIQLTNNCRAQNLAALLFTLREMKPFPAIWIVCTWNVKSNTGGCYMRFRSPKSLYKNFPYLSSFTAVHGSIKCASHACPSLASLPKHLRNTNVKPHECYRKIPHTSDWKVPSLLLLVHSLRRNFSITLCMGNIRSL